MPSLHEKLQALGVKVGARDLPAPAPKPVNLLEAALGGRSFSTHFGETYLVDAHYPRAYLHGKNPLWLSSGLQMLSRWAGNAHIAELAPQEFAFLDTETTGLSGGAGTYAFLIGVGRFEQDEFHLAQFFMRNPLEEPAQLAALEEFLAPCQAIVTYNGKAFDAPLLNSRYVTHGWENPLASLAHIDLLHLARRLWRDRLPSRTLMNLEAQILAAVRTEEDIPGWMVPQRYFDYLSASDPQLIKGVFYHNAMDVLSLAALMNRMAALLEEPHSEGSEHGVDLLALAKLYEDFGDYDLATSLYLHGLDHEDSHAERIPQAIFLDALMRLAQIYKRNSELEAAITLWKQAAQHQHLPAIVELSKVFEHRYKDMSEASHWTLEALALLEGSGLPASRNASLSGYERRRWIEEFNHRLRRLKNKQLNTDEP